jgi:hypothetical protein
MPLVNINLATEDELSEAVGIRLVAELGNGFAVANLLGKKGNTYLKTNLKKYCAFARLHPLLLITDLDQEPCPAALISKWMNTLPRPNNFLFRVAVREVEAWLLSDHDAIKQLLDVSSRLPGMPDTLFDPKRALLELAKKAPREVKKNLLPEPGAVASKGLGYNSRMIDFVRRMWSPRRAATRSNSLCRARERLRILADKLKAAS